MQETTRETIPGMAEAIEARRLRRRLSPGAFAKAAGVSGEALRPIRRGELRGYQDKVLLGVADALGWREDWYERLQEGEDPDGLIAADGITADAIMRDPELDDAGRSRMLALYAELRR